MVPKSQFGEDYLSDNENHTRIAISLGRYYQNPISELLLLWSILPETNLALKIVLHPLQNKLNQVKLMERYEVEVIKVCNHIGVDLNYIYDKPHLQAPLQFISGLGFHKATALINRIKSLSGVSSRLQIKESELLPPKIFANCSCLFTFYCLR